jgi:methylglyoxal synthase
MSASLRCRALIAHDNHKVDLVAWATFNRGR